MSLSKPLKCNVSSDDSDLEQLFTKIKRRRVRQKLLSSVLKREHSSPSTSTPSSSMIENETENVSTVSVLHQSIILSPFYLE